MGLRWVSFLFTFEKLPIRFRIRVFIIKNLMIWGSVK